MVSVLRKGVILYSVGVSPLVAYGAYTAAVQTLDQCKVRGDSKLKTLDEVSRNALGMAGIAYVLPLIVVPQLVSAVMNPDGTDKLSFLFPTIENINILPNLNGTYSFMGYTLTIHNWRIE